MGRFARSQSGALSEGTAFSAARPASVSARPRFSSGSHARPQVKSQPYKQPGHPAKPDSSTPRSFSPSRRARKRMRLIALAVMSLIGLGVGWMLGKTVMGPSRIDESQPAVSMQSAIEHKSAVNPDEKANDSDGDDKSATKSVGDAGLEARIDDAQ